MKILTNLFYVGVMLGALMATAELFFVVTTANISAPQQAGTMAVALGWVIIPYCFARAFEQIVGK